MYPHRIRLRGHWECAAEGQNPRRCTVPCQLAEFGLIETPVRLIRKFGYPGRIDAHERVWLTLADINGSATLTLNDHLLGEAQNGPLEADVTKLLGPRNRLEIVARGSHVGEVAMEVRATAFLQRVKAHRADGKLQCASDDNAAPA